MTLIPAYSWRDHSVATQHSNSWPHFTENVWKLSQYAACANEHQDWGLNQTRPSLPVVSNCSPLSIITGFDTFSKNLTVTLKLHSRKLTCSNFRTEHPQTLSTAVQNLVTTVTGRLAIVHPCRLIWHRGTSVSEETAANFFWVQKSHRSFFIRESSENLRKINIFLWQKTRMSFCRFPEQNSFYGVDQFILWQLLRLARRWNGK